VEEGGDEVGMAYLALVGIGMEEEDITLKGLRVARESDECFIELYTSVWKGDVKRLEEIVGRRIEQLDREHLEEKSGEILDLACKKKVCILVPGDPLVATTHVHLVLECIRRNVRCIVVSAPSIATLCARCGLQLYKFGRTCTLPSTLEIEHVRKTVENNRKINAHSLILLDVGMDVDTAVRVLEESGVARREEMVFLYSLHTKEEEISREVKRKSPCAIVVPASLHFLEREFLQEVEKKPISLV
jgi:diphthine synthase